MRIHYVLPVLAIALAACARNADMVPLNAAATAVGIPRLDLTLYGTGYGPAVMTMPDGEVLQGHYRLAIGGAISSGYATAVVPRGVATISATSTTTPMQNPFTLQATGNRGTIMTCQGSAGGLGHGDAVCSTNRGAQYQMMF